MAAAPVVDAEYLKEIEKARRDLRSLISSKNSCAPLMLRLAWYDAGTYNAKTKKGGPNGSIRNAPELKQPANSGLKTAVDLCEEVKTKHPKLTYADLYQLAGVVAVEVTGGPTIDFTPGRTDSKVPPAEGRLLDGKQGASQLRDMLYRTGFTDKDVVALFGGLTIMDKEAFLADYVDSKKKLSDISLKGPKEGASLLRRIFGDHLSFTDKEIVALILGTVLEEPAGKEGQSTRDQYFNELLKKDRQSDSLFMKQPINKVLVEDPDFMKCVEIYAKDEAANLKKDYEASRKKLSESETTPNSRLTPEERQLITDAKQGASGLREIFGRLRFTDKEIVADLSGGHTSGKVQQESPRDRLKFDNSYYKEVLLKKEPNELLKFPSNKALVETYAKDEDAFFADYAASHKKLSELGFKPPSSVPTPASRNRAILTQGAIGIAVATTMVILGFLLGASRRRST